MTDFIGVTPSSWGVMLAELPALVPDASWDVPMLREMVGGILGLCIVMAVVAVILGVLRMVPGKLTGNMMKSAFAWRTLAASIMVPVIVGGVSGAWAFQQTALGATGLTAVASRSQPSSTLGVDGTRASGDGHSDDPQSLINALASAVASAILPSIDGVRGAVSSLGSALSDGLASVGSTVGSALGSVTDGMGSLAGKVGDLWDGMWSWWNDS